MQYKNSDDVKTLVTITSNPVLSVKQKPVTRKPLAKSNFTDPNVYLKFDPIKSIGKVN